MREEETQRVIAEASKDARIEATLETRFVTKSGEGYEVILTLRRGQRRVMIRHVQDWQVIQELWKDL